MGQHPWRILAELPAWQVAEVPRPHGDQASAGIRDPGVAQRAQAVASAYGCDAPFALGWVRDQVGGPVRILAAGPAMIGGTDVGQTVLTFPAGARGVPLPAGAAAKALSTLPCWTRMAGVADVLLAGGEPGPDDQEAPSLEQGLLSAWLDAFGWLLLAEPVDAATVNEMAEHAASAQLAAEQFSSPRAKLAARRAAARHDELRRAFSTGLWRVHLLAGAATPIAAARVARLICASVDLRGLPYALSTWPGTGFLPDMLATADDGQAPARDRPAGPTGPTPDAGDRSWWYTPMGAAGAWPGTGGVVGQWPDSGYSSSPGGGAPAAVAQQAEEGQATPVPESPFVASTRLVAALARVPAREVPGLRCTLRPEFDVTPEITLTAPHSPVQHNGLGSAAATTLTSGSTPTAGISSAAWAVLAAGTVLDWNRVPAGTLSLPLESLNRHVFVCGATGAGKSQTVRNLLEQATHAGIPWLVVEPAKAEYRLMAARLPSAQVICIRPGDLDRPAAAINPLEPAPGPGGSRFSLQTHADLLRALFLAAFQADEPFPQVLSAALTKCYEQAGWDLVTGRPATPGIQPSYPGLEDLQAAAMAVVNEIGYGREIRDNVRGFVTVRIGSLRLGTTGRFLDGGHTLDFTRLLDTNVVLEIEDAGDDHDKAFLMGTVLIRLIEHLRLRHRHEGPAPPRLRHLTVVEEAHRLLRQPSSGISAGASSHAVEMFADLLAEIRAYGEGLIIAEQIPAKLIPDAIKNTAVKICHRLPAADDRAAVGATMNLSDAQSEYLVTLPPGEAAVHADRMDYPLLTRMPDGTARETTGVAGTVSPEPVIARRSLTCGPDCRTAPCTLGQMRAAQRVTVTDPRITLWAELTVVAHLTGWDMPRPSPIFITGLRRVDSRLRDCAISHAADAAVAARAPAISSRVSPGRLAAHAVDVMRQVISNGSPGCEDEEPDHLAPPYRWTLVRDALRSALQRQGSGRHPRSDEWERIYGEPVSGDTTGQQIRVVNRWYRRDQRDPQAVSAVLWGVRSHPAIERAVGARVIDRDWPGQLAEALDAFTRVTWPNTVLRRAPAPSPAATRRDF